MAKAIYRHEGLLEAISTQAQRTAASFAPQNLANSSWAFAKLQRKDEGLLRALSKQMEARKAIGRALAEISYDVDTERCGNRRYHLYLDISRKLALAS